MLTSIATVSLSGELDEKLRAIADAGFQGVEIFESDFLTFDGSPADVRRLLERLGLSCVAFQPFRDFEGMPEPQRSRAFERAERKFAIMSELGADLLLVCSNVSPASLGGIDRAAADLRELGERAAAHGLRVGFEALAWGRHISDYRDAWEVVRRADHPAVGLVLDSYHMLARGLPVDAVRAIPGDRIFLVQLADAPDVDMDVMQLSRHFRCMPGQGDLPLEAFMAALEATGYDGPLSLEIFNDQFRAAPARAVATDGARSLIALADRRQPATAPAAQRTACDGVEFVEFAADEATGEQLARLFRQLGFRRVGRHRSKSVTVWQQGGIHLVINQESDGFAHTYRIVHGPSVCAMALRVGDVEQVVARAQRLRFRTFDQPVGPGELRIPAIRGVGGSLIHFVGRDGPLADIWSVDFLPESATAQSGEDVGLTMIDHLAQTMTHGEMQSWQLAYTALLELDKLPQLDIAEPGGLVQSQALQTPDGRVRLVLNSSQSPRTLSSRFLTELFGAGTQHVAFRTDDIFATMQRIRANGLEPLAIPANYYDDLDARFGLDGDLLDNLRRHHVLYDRDDGGEYFQVYSRAFAGRFFFEIVQRRDYAGFGAANAPVRLAAQARSSEGAKLE